MKFSSKCWKSERQSFTMGLFLNYYLFTAQLSHWFLHQQESDHSRLVNIFIITFQFFFSFNVYFFFRMPYQTVISHSKISPNQRQRVLDQHAKYMATDSSSKTLHQSVGSENKTAKVVLYRSPEHTDCYVVDRMADYRLPKVLEALCNYLCTFIILSYENGPKISK